MRFPRRVELAEGLIGCLQTATRLLVFSCPPLLKEPVHALEETRRSEKSKIQPKDELTDRDLEKVSGGFEITDFSFDIEQTLNIGSQSTGAGPSKVTKK